MEKGAPAGAPGCRGRTGGSDQNVVENGKAPATIREGRNEGVVRRGDNDFTAVDIDEEHRADQADMAAGDQFGDGLSATIQV